MTQVTSGQWIDALRSGNYQQGRGSLRNQEDKFCCLGVLCDLLAPYAWQANGADDPTSQVWTGLGPGLVRGIALPPDEINQQIDPVMRVGHDPVYAMNDNGCSFKEIADSIEDRLSRNTVITLIKRGN